mmetsp:Transcript_7167/g.12228  ORF Transcript_7167/g.12228 Transcript_7167/m.12228 type:complete len:219 (-) Transcript_7167:87-743(-)|eukprot:CAMPEP_0196655988 /NCGR_PEP_ID=MMETSP1086-20130531/11832_1 /TAXON_ID=77921 /ORGANISM="Cyanoptyche  gloeocystis , Strain SAG4.97" /LENGTH=218 /DNA_ID=CAMNT_0041988557 /DNA_START=52 /DNA_END=708 /DNA_ORIENTATION=+
MSPLQITYFNMKGRQSCMVLLLEDQKIPYDLVSLAFGSPQWQEFKKQGLEDGTLPFGQVPQLKDGDIYLVQCAAIMRHLARKCGLDGNDAMEVLKCDMYTEAVADMRIEATKNLYADFAKGFEELKAVVFPKHAAYFEAILKRNGTDYLVRNTVTYADFLLFELLDQFLEFAVEIVEPFPLLKAYYERMQSRPNIAAFKASGRELPSWFAWKFGKVSV